MIISFKPQFVPKILAGTKIHTLRTDATNRWQAGRKMHMYTGRYTATDRQFIKEAECVSVQQVQLNVLESGLKLIWVDNRLLNTAEAIEFCRNDGFEGEADFWQWFTTTQTLKLIHWTDKRY